MFWQNPFTAAKVANWVSFLGLINLRCAIERRINARDMVSIKLETAGISIHDRRFFC